MKTLAFLPKDGRGRSLGRKRINQRYRRGTDLFRPACGGPPSPEPLPSVAGEGFDNRASRHSCSLLPVPCSLYTSLCVSVNSSINQNLTLGSVPLSCFLFTLSWKGDSKNRPRCQVYLRFLFIQAIEAIVGIPIGHTSMQDRDFEQFLPKCAP